jgi:hypothetical protein
MKMIDAGKKTEVIRALNDAESKAVPLFGIGRSEYLMMHLVP